MALNTKGLKKKRVRVITRRQFSWHMGILVSATTRLVLALVLLAWISDPSSALQLSPDESTAEEQAQESRWHAQQLEFGGHSRTYVAYAPASYDGQKPVPLVLVLHGTASKPREDLVRSCKGIVRFTKWEQKAEAEGFIAVAPVALGSSLNEGSGRGGSGFEDVDDVGFIEAVLDDVSGRFAIDQDRIYVTGFSSGASMAQRLAVEMSHRIAAIGAVGGHLWSEDRAPAAARPVLLLFGTEDPLNPIDGGKVRYGFAGLDLVLDKPAPVTTAKMWARRLECSSGPTELSDKDGVRAVAWRPCANGAEVLFYTVAGLGHQWPGGMPLPKKWAEIVGKYTDVINATDLIWDFFSRQRRR